ncbi:MAG: transposase [Armatimonadota bacterium]|nr:transposase [Armatimonadota bacterium]
MQYRHYPPPAPRLLGYDPYIDVPKDHLARLVEQVVEETIGEPVQDFSDGQPAFDPRLPIKVLVFGYATGIRSSRVLERMSQESLPFLFLTRGDAPSYRTLCTSRVNYKEQIEEIWLGLFKIAEELGLKRMGRVTLDATKIRGRVDIPMIYDAGTNSYTCPQGNQLCYTGTQELKGQQRQGYRAKNSCKDCPLAKDCLSATTATGWVEELLNMQRDLISAQEVECYENWTGFFTAPIRVRHRCKSKKWYCQQHAS